MKLAAYLEREALRPSQFAARIGVPPSSVIRWLNGERSPRIEAMLMIQTATEGAVTPADWIAEFERARAESDRPFPGPGGDGSENTESHAKPHEAA